jgi:hypothetical protein
VCEARKACKFGADVLAGDALPVGEAREGAERGTSFVTRKFGQESNVSAIVAIGTSPLCRTMQWHCHHYAALWSTMQ